MTATTVAQERRTDGDRAAAGGLGAAVRDYIARVRGGDVGSLPAVLGLVVLVIVFSVLRPSTFTNAFNFSNLHPPGRRGDRHRDGPGLRAAARRDRPVRRLHRRHRGGGDGHRGDPQRGWPWWISVLVCLATGAVIGAFIGLLVARLGIPSFVVTLAAFLGAAGRAAQAHRRGRHDRDPGPGAAGASTTTTCRSGSAGRSTWSSSAATRPSCCAGRRRRRAGGLQYEALSVLIAKIVALAVLLGLVTVLPEHRAQPEPQRSPRSRACPTWSRCCWSCWSG